MKQEITQKVDSFTLWDLEGNIQKAIDYLIKIRDRNLNYKSLELVTPCEYEGDVSVKVMAVRMETDEEVEIRKTKEKTRIDNAKKERRLQYERLKKEFES